jgi:nicotinamide-nucleotide amidase
VEQKSFQDLVRIAEELSDMLRARQETVAVAESSAGGLIAASLLAVGGASAYFQGGGVVYTRAAKARLLHLDESVLIDPRPATEPHALILARGARDILETTWGIGETGATGPTGNRYGDPPGHAAIAVAGPIELSTTVQTGAADRAPNMMAFAEAALNLLKDALVK